MSEMGDASNCCARLNKFVVPTMGWEECASWVTCLGSVTCLILVLV